MEINVENILKKQNTVNAFTALFSSIFHGLTPYYNFHIVPDLDGGSLIVSLLNWSSGQRVSNLTLILKGGTYETV